MFDITILNFKEMNWNYFQEILPVNNLSIELTTDFWVFDLCLVCLS